MNIERISNQTRSMIAGTMVAIQFVALFIIGILALSNLHASSHPYFGTEILAVILGITIIASAGISLRPSLRISPIPKKNSPLVETGIYRRVRHPMYLAVILIGFGLAGYANSAISWILELLLVVDLNIKARYEDALLREIHPESLHYQLHVSRILPCLGGSCRANCDMK